MAKILSLLLLCATCQAGTVHIVLTNWPYLPPTNTLQIFQTRPSVSGIYFAYGNPIRIPYRGVGIYTNFFTGRYEFRIEGFTFNPPIQFPVPDCDCTNELASLIGTNGVSISFTNPPYVVGIMAGTNVTIQASAGIYTINSSGGSGGSSTNSIVVSAGTGFNTITNGLIVTGYATNATTLVGQVPSASLLAYASLNELNAASNVTWLAANTGSNVLRAAITALPTNWPASAITNANFATTNFITGLSNEFNIFNRIATNSVSSNRFTFTGGTFSGTNSWSPSADGVYNFMCPRDAINAVRAAPWLFSAEDIRNLCKQVDSLYNKTGVNDIGVGINFDGTLINAGVQSDHSFDYTSLLYQSWLKEGKGTPVMWNAYSVHASNTFASVTVTNHLMYNDPEGWGFTESTGIWGYHVTGSLFRYRACAEMHLLTTAAGHPTTFYTNEMRLIAAQLKIRAYDSSVHLFRFGTASALDANAAWNVHDILGSALAVSLGACDIADSRDISYALADMVDAGPFYHGAPKYVPNSEADQWYVYQDDYGANGSGNPGHYQEGGYWPEFASWCAEAIRRVRPDLSDSIMVELAAHYSSQAGNKVPYEWENFTSVGAAMYLDSATMPLEYWTRPLWQLSTNFPVIDAGLFTDTVSTENFFDLRGPNGLYNGSFNGNGGGLTNIQTATTATHLSLTDSNEIVAAGRQATNNSGSLVNLKSLTSVTADVATSVSDAANITNGTIPSARYKGQGVNSVKLGSAASAGGNSISIGPGADSSGSNSIAIGYGALGQSKSTSALGDAANAAYQDSTAVGQNSTTTKTNQVTLGLANGEVNIPGNLQFATGNLGGGTNIPAAQLTGTVADARLSANVAMLDRSPQTFTGAINNFQTVAASTFSVSGSVGLAGPVNFTNSVTMQGTETNTTMGAGVLYSDVNGKRSSSGTSASLSSALTDETGTGLAVFNQQPTFSISTANTGITVSKSYQSRTNSWTVNTPWDLNVSATLVQGAATLGVPAIANVPSTNYGFSELVMITTGTVVFTNDNSINASDRTNSRSYVTGSCVEFTHKVTPGLVTNLFIVQTAPRQ